MRKIFVTISSVICLTALLIASAGCSIFGAAQPEAAKQTITVQRGTLAQTVSVDGNLQMPQAFNLSFGAPGNVKDVFVTEGDYVKAGTMLARLDSVTQQLNIRSANNGLQTALSNLYETIPALQQVFPVTTRAQQNLPVMNPDPTIIPTPPPYSIPQLFSSEQAYWEVTAKGYTNYYPNASAALSASWSQDEVSKAQAYFSQNNYGNAAIELRVAASDLQSCIQIFQDAITNPYSGLGNMAEYAKNPELAETLGQYTNQIMYIQELQRVIDLIKQNRSDLAQVQTLLIQSKYPEAKALLDNAQAAIADSVLAVRGDVNWIKVPFDQSAPGKTICLYFYGAAQDKLNQSLTSIQKSGLSWSVYSENARMAIHYIQLCNSIMGGNVLVLEHGLSLKNYQQYNINLGLAAVTLDNSKSDLLKTVLIAPFDGTVVSVGVKQNDVLSNIDYSSKVAVQLVDITQVKFQGLVDEIDILKIQYGQKASISVDAIPDKTFNGTVTFISPFGTPDATSRVVQFPITVELKLDSGDADLLKGGLTATANISITNIENALLVPITAITSTPTEKSVTVLVDEATGKTEKRVITVGRQNQQVVEVTSGLKEGDKIVIEQKLSVGAPVISRPQQPQPKPQGK